MAYTLVLLRHGESTWNQENLFTGWHDVAAVRAGARPRPPPRARPWPAEGLRFDIAHTSVLTRAVQTADLALAELGQLWLPVERHWRLNERHYGALQGLDKKQTAEQHGAEQIKLWRRSYDVPPPPVDADDPRAPGATTPATPRLAPDVLPGDRVPATSSRGCCRTGTTPIVPDLRAGLTRARRRPRQQPAGAGEAPRRHLRRGHRRGQHPDRRSPASTSSGPTSRSNRCATSATPSRGRGGGRRGQAPGGLTTGDQVASNVAMTWSKVLLYLSG